MALAGRQDGVALIAVVAILGVMLVVGGIAIYASSSGARQSAHSASNLTALGLAEAGVNKAMAVISNPSSVLTDPNLLMQRIDVVAGGSITWKGTYDATYARWAIESTGQVPNPTGAADIKRKATARVWVANVVFTTTRAMGDGTSDREIWVMNLDGSGAYAVTNNGWEDGDAFWSPDTGTFVYESEEMVDSNSNAGLGYGPGAPPHTNRDLYSMRVDGTQKTRLTTSAGTVGWNGSSADEDPQWGPNGKIVFDSFRNGHSNNGAPGDPNHHYVNNWDVYVMDVTGANQANLTPCVPDNPSTSGNEANYWTTTANPARCSNDQEPAYGPSGIVCIQSAKNDNADLIGLPVTVSGSSVTSGTPFLLAGGANEQRECDWSPDGSKVAYMENTGGGDYEIWVVSSDGTGKTQLTSNTVADEHPGWTPDGRIVFNSRMQSGATNSNNADGGEEMFVMNANGTNVVQLTFTGATAENRFPDVRGTYVPYDFSS